MQKRGILFVFLFSLIALMAVNFVSAAFHYGGYSLSDILNTFDPSTVILLTIFIIAFILIFWPLSKFFRENPMLAGIIAFAMSGSLIFEVNRRGLDFTGFFYSIGISGGILYTIAPLILLAGFFYISYSKLERRFKFYRAFLVLGGLLIVASFTDIIYAKGATFILGAIIFGVGILLWRRGRKRGFGGYDYQGYDTYSGPSQRQVYKQQRTQQKYQQKLENQSAELKRQAHEAEVRRRAEKIAKIRKRREKNK